MWRRWWLWRENNRNMWWRWWWWRENNRIVVAVVVVRVVEGKQ